MSVLEGGLGPPEPEKSYIPNVSWRFLILLGQIKAQTFKILIKATYQEKRHLRLCILTKILVPF